MSKRKPCSHIPGSTLSFIIFCVFATYWMFPTSTNVAMGEVQVSCAPCAQSTCPKPAAEPRPNSCQKIKVNLSTSASENTQKQSLVVIAVGGQGKDKVDKIVRAFGFERYTFILFHYDNSDWSDVEWISRVIRIEYPNQMKWWYLKRFVTPQVASSFEFIIAVDEDAGMEQIPVEPFLDLFRKHNITIGQPAQTRPGGYWDVNRQQQHVEGSNRIGRWTDFVECGPFTVMASSIYQQCIWDLMQEDLSSGIGLDLVWTDHCGRLGWEGFAVIDKYPVVHLDLKTASKQTRDRPIYEPEFEMREYLHRIRQVTNPLLRQNGFKTLGYIEHAD